MKKIFYEQLSLFSGDASNNNRTEITESINVGTEALSVSDRLLDSFNVSSIPFIGCDFEILYPRLEKVIPAERVSFPNGDLETLIACETVCAAICHQMNWDFLRQVVLKKTLEQPNWITAKALSHILESDVSKMLAGYNRPERIRAGERATILRNVGQFAESQGGFTKLFFDTTGRLLQEWCIHSNLLKCSVFASDPEEKKLQLLLQKLSNYEKLSGLTEYCKPAVDYHLIRCFLRRGLIYPTTKFGKSYILSKEAVRRESTVGALRQLCAFVVNEISNYTGLSINSINQIEWHIGRSICKEGKADCNLDDEDAGWALAEFKKCPYYKTCVAVNYDHRLLHIDEPNYTGTSY